MNASRWKTATYALVTAVATIFGCATTLQRGGKDAIRQLDSLDDFDTALAAKHLLIVIKGTAEAPADRYSRRLIEAAGSTPYYYVDVLRHPAILATLKERFEWPTSPMVFHNGELIGGASIGVEYIVATFPGARAEDDPYRDVPEHQLNSLDRLLKNSE